MHIMLQLKKIVEKYNQIRRKKENKDDENSIPFSSISYANSKFIIFDNESIHFQLHRLWMSHYWSHTPNHMVVQFK